MANERAFVCLVVTPNPDRLRNGGERVAFLESFLHEDAFPIAAWNVEVAPDVLAVLVGSVPWYLLGIKVPVASGEMIVPSRWTSMIRQDLSTWKKKKQWL